MSIQIVTDSTCDLPESVRNEFAVTVVPVYINVNGQSYLDGIEMTRAEFYNNLPAYRTPPTTSAPGIGSFVETYTQLASRGASEIISIHAAGALSNIFNVAKLASEALENVKIAVVDLGSTSLGLGFQALIAAKASRGGKSISEIVELLRRKITGTYLFAALDTIDYLRRSGRLSTLQAGLGSLLNIKPVLSLNNGKLRMETIRTRSRSIDRMISMVTSLWRAGLPGDCTCSCCSPSGRAMFADHAFTSFERKTYDC